MPKGLIIKGYGKNFSAGGNLDAIFDASQDPNHLASMMDVPVTQIIATCMSIGMFVSINQRLDAETISLLAEEFGFRVKFQAVDVQ